ncbi:MAG: tRNA (adenosine(37)-N6)-threonylcarbamoyltransferase complex ATPase subunit type 1 TsaE [Phycisphaerae bacterium]|jgi:tRNA threonylcarbamoyladenosine biosynthesis protein TsaE|nr:tRNA (adenosine(37)-N6)-threonylcarbamoyltransferase complex ATPase subunit type 1 TsaE [Phycisphaerae bacterium]MBT6270061.1 tRNA (adenosine(37)-N6)-threonylcarbamoyltransferase complex ATPase subunit type 1 TsaE [Phycisphaerae bacterium]MBT7658581.1 tRNA (adenosine(37)-N6)-threonylcarbamoyltransferase complex ATPase subunit type 1 TsaE [Phycisphaerae bacterium]
MTLLASEQETIAFAKEFASQLQGGSILLLDGDLGAGKTCFVRGLCEGLGGDPSQVSSPTFAILQEYTIEDGLTLIHIDAYRLSGEEELESIGWDEYVADQNVVIAIEWPSNISSAIPSNAILLKFNHVNMHTREITLQ